MRHRIQVKLDRIAQKPIIDHTTEPVSVQNGTSVTVQWNGVASYLTHSHLNLYREVPLTEALADFDFGVQRLQSARHLRFQRDIFPGIRSRLVQMATQSADLRTLVPSRGPTRPDCRLYQRVRSPGA